MNQEGIKGKDNALKISVITVSCNSDASIADTIESVNEQTYPLIEHVFVDGASTDQTVAIIESKSLRKTIVCSEPDSGIYDALNKGLALSTGDIIGFLNADDYYAHSGVLSQIAEIFMDNAVSGVYGDLLYVGQSNTNKIIRRWNTKEFSKARLKSGWMPPHPTLYIRRFWFDRIGGFDTRYEISADYLFILKLFGSPGFSASYIPDVLVKMRVGGVSNRSLKNIIQKSLEDYSALKRTGVGGLRALISKNLRKLGQFN